MLRLIFALLLVPVASHAGQAARVLRVATSEFPVSWNWKTSVEASGAIVIQNVMEGLIDFDDFGLIRPRLAEKWRFSAENSKLTITLRKGVRWSDGRELRAQDFIDSWNYDVTSLAAGMNQAFDCVQRKPARDAAGLEKQQLAVTSPDGATLEIEFRSPCPDFMTRLLAWNTYPVRLDRMRASGDRSSYDAQGWTRAGELVGLGPYLLAKPSPGESADNKIVLKRNPAYFDRAPAFEEVQITQLEHDASAAGLIRSDRADVVLVRSLREIADLKPGARSFDGVQLVRYPALQTFYLGFNIDKYPLTLAPVREALAKAFDRKSLFESAEVFAKPTSRFVPAFLVNQTESLGAATPAPGPAAAATLEKAGLSAAMRRQTTLTLFGKDTDFSALMLDRVAQQVTKTLGFKVKVDMRGAKDYATSLAVKDAHIYLLTWWADYPSAQNFLDVFRKDNRNNSIGWKSAAYDRLLDEALSESSPSRRAILLRRAEQMLIDESHVVYPLAIGQVVLLAKPGLSGFSRSPMVSLNLRGLR